MSNWENISGDEQGQKGPREDYRKGSWAFKECNKNNVGRTREVSVE